MELKDQTDGPLNLNRILGDNQPPSHFPHRHGGRRLEMYAAVRVLDADSRRSNITNLGFSRKNRRLRDVGVSCHLSTTCNPSVSSPCDVSEVAISSSAVTTGRFAITVATASGVRPSSSV